MTLVGVAARDRAKAQAWLDEQKIACPLVDLAAFPQHADLAIECAPAAIIEDICRPMLQAGKRVMVLSAGALLPRPELIELAKEAGGLERLQKAVDWMFLLTVEWFGLPDELKLHKGQLSYGIKGSSNDTLRQQWLGQAVPFCAGLGLNVPAKFSEATGKYLVTVPFPAEFDASKKRWQFEKGKITWDDVMKRWKARGTMNDYYIERIQRGYHELMN